MIRFPALAVLLPALSLAASPAWSCMTYAKAVAGDVASADLVVVGRIENYEVVLDPKARERRKEQLRTLPADVSPEYRRILEEQDGFLSDYARFEIRVDEVLAGDAPDRLIATWDNSTFGEPDSLPTGPWIIALVAPGSRQPPLRGPSATILPSPEPEMMRVLQAPCAPPFIVETDSGFADEIRVILRP